MTIKGNMNGSHPLSLPSHIGTWGTGGHTISPRHWDNQRHLLVTKGSDITKAAGQELILTYRIAVRELSRLSALQRTLDALFACVTMQRNSCSKQPSNKGTEQVILHFNCEMKIIIHPKLCWGKLCIHVSTRYKITIWRVQKNSV